LRRFWSGLATCWHWLSIHSADPSTIVDYFLQFGASLGLAKSRCSFMYLIWFASSWVIWKERNARIFHAKESTTYQLLENIKLLSFWWIKAHFDAFHYKIHDWCHNPFLYFCVG
jgi:hypothetical protein